MAIKVILNPYSGRWKGQLLRNEAELALNQAGVKFDLIQTEHHGHGIELAAQAARDGYESIIAAGGDGSISEVVNGLMQAVEKGAKMPTLGILPLGTANDLVANLNLPTDLATAARVIATGKTLPVDLGSINYTTIDHTSKDERKCYFDNNSAIGLEPCVTLVQQKIKWLKGTSRYMASAVIAVMQKPSWRVRMEWENGQYQGPISLVTVGNGRITGGFYMTPHANPYDGKLTFVYGFVPRRREMFGLLPKALKPDKGSYVEADAIHEINSSWLRVSLEKPTPLHADGEIQTENAIEVEWRIHSGALKVFSNYLPEGNPSLE